MITTIVLIIFSSQSNKKYLFCFLQYVWLDTLKVLKKYTSNSENILPILSSIGSNQDLLQ